MLGAAEGGHKDLVDFFISQGANNWKLGLSYAKKSGNPEIIKFFEEKLKNKTNNSKTNKNK